VRPELTVDQVIRLHDSMTLAPVIDRGKLESGVQRAFAGHASGYFYNSVWSQTAALIHGIVAAHGFLDGNKRAAWASGMTLLALNGIELIRITDEETANYMVEVANGVHTLEQTAFLLAGLVKD
jgi:death-on-curing protein